MTYMGIGLVTRGSAREPWRFCYVGAGSMNKAPLVTLAFWIIKISATTVGETGGDAVSMSEHLGYAVSTAIFFAIFVVLLTAQISSKRFIALLYWAVIVATTTCGT